MSIPHLTVTQPFPPLETALREPNGLLAFGGGLSPQRILSAYKQGIFPWYGPGQPIQWWSPDPRMVLFPDELKISRFLAKRMRKRDYEVTADENFRAVIEACATTPRAGQNGTWIVPEMIEAYCILHALGHAHSVECWMDNKLVGGLYGVTIGRMFFGESMFHHVTDASKIAFVTLVKQLKKRGYEMIDCQMKTEHLASLGAREIPRSEFVAKVKELTEDVGTHFF
ncbi:MAG: leucyl/phenylalanyl-tRNA--protein transferase [Methylophilaceae bacterium]